MLESIKKLPVPQRMWRGVFMLMGHSQQQCSMTLGMGTSRRRCSRLGNLISRMTQTPYVLQIFLRRNSWRKGREVFFINGNTIFHSANELFLVHHVDYLSPRSRVSRVFRWHTEITEHTELRIALLSLHPDGKHTLIICVCHAKALEISTNCTCIVFSPYPTTRQLQRFEADVK